VLRSPSPTSCFFFGFVIFILLGSPFEVQLFAQFSTFMAIFIAAFVYARKSRERREVQQKGRRSGHKISIQPAVEQSR
jgi:membrane protein implicated in regulation of membrane protease activity